MSKRNQHNPGGGGISNPAKKFYQWKGGEWSYYDGEAKERKSVPACDMVFTVLDEFNGVTGFNDKLQQGYWSTEARPGEPLTVHCGNNQVGEGLWKDLKSNQDLKFQKVLYVMTKFNGEPELARIGLSGSSFGPWLELTTGRNAAKEAVSEPVNPQGDIAIYVTDVKDGKKGAVAFKSPVFATKPISEETAKEAEVAFEQVEEYFNAKKQDKASGTPHEDAPTQDMEDEPIPF